MNKVVELINQMVSVLSELAEVLEESKSRETETEPMVELFTVKECAEVTGCSEYSIRKWIAEGVIKPVKIDSCKNGKVLINKKSIIDFLNSD